MGFFFLFFFLKCCIWGVKCFEVFLLPSASLQCCLVAYGSSSIVQGYEGAETALHVHAAWTVRADETVCCRAHVGLFLQYLGGGYTILCSCGRYTCPFYFCKYQVLLTERRICFLKEPFICTFIHLFIEWTFTYRCVPGIVLGTWDTLVKKTVISDCDIHFGDVVHKNIP